MLEKSFLHCFGIFLMLYFGETQISHTSSSDEHDISEMNIKGIALNDSDVTKTNVTDLFPKILKIHDKLYIKEQLVKKYLSCEEGQAYQSFNSCIEDCKVRQTLTDLYDMPNTKAYKVLFLLPNEFTITQDGELNISNWNSYINNDSYVAYSDGTVRACLPLSAQLDQCALWDIPSFRLKFYNDGYNVWLKTYFVGYEWNEFFIRRQTTYLCKPTSARIVRLLYKVGIFVSTASLILLFLLLKFIPELYRNCLLLCHLVMLLILYVVICCRYIVADRNVKTACIVTSAFIQFTVLSAFFWTNAQAVHLYQNFRKLNASLVVTFRRFVCYSIICWGIPLVLVTIAVVTEIHEINHLRPGFSMETCWFFDGEFIRPFLYYFGWQGLSFFINIVLFILIVRIFCKMAKEAASTKGKNLKPLFLTFIKIAVIMGLHWIFSWSTKMISRAYDFPALIIWCFDIVTSFQGFYILIIYTVNKTFLHNIISNFACLKKERNNYDVELSYYKNNESNITNSVYSLHKVK